MAGRLISASWLISATRVPISTCDDLVACLRDDGPTPPYSHFRIEAQALTSIDAETRRSRESSAGCRTRARQVDPPRCTLQAFDRDSTARSRPPSRNRFLRRTPTTRYVGCTPKIPARIPTLATASRRHNGPLDSRRQ